MQGDPEAAEIQRLLDRSKQLMEEFRRLRVQAAALCKKIRANYAHDYGPEAPPEDAN